MIYFFVTKDGKVCRHRARYEEVVGGGILRQEQLVRIIIKTSGVDSRIDYSYDELNVRRNEGKQMIPVGNGEIVRVDIFNPKESYEKF